MLGLKSCKLGRIINHLIPAFNQEMTTIKTYRNYFISIMQTNP